MENNEQEKISAIKESLIEYSEIIIQIGNSRECYNDSLDLHYHDEVLLDV